MALFHVFHAFHAYQQLAVGRLTANQPANFSDSYQVRALYNCFVCWHYRAVRCALSEDA